MKAASLKRLYALWFHSYDTIRQNYKDRKQNNVFWGLRVDVRADYKGSFGEILWEIGLLHTLILVVIVHTYLNFSKVFAKLYTKNVKFYCM